jgi:hypothetical protein
MCFELSWNQSRELATDANREKCITKFSDHNDSIAISFLFESPYKINKPMYAYISISSTALFLIPVFIIQSNRDFINLYVMKF